MNNNPSLFEQYTNFDRVNWEKILSATYETLFMTCFATLAVFFLGITVGYLLYRTTQRSHKKTIVAQFLSGIVNLFRAIPFLNLIVLLIPVTKLLLNTITGPAAALPALILSATPFFARMVETGLRDIDRGVLEVADAMGMTAWQKFSKVYFPESLPTIVSGITSTAIALVGYTAMAGVIGAGGLGNLAYLEGFQRNNATVTLVATFIILVIVFLIQWTGDILVRKIDKR
ncbi:methionine ABC transporter permease [Allofustis seminis]|uniref:methionine ABC transporter permease n=1 Tax=Allofustis seminis TaxID=166939 RepID=UPI00036A3F94|nr:methionine ABC transporter permease [Allofustis seminis]